MSALHERSEKPYVVSAVAGVAAYLLGYLTTYVWQASQVREMLRGINAVLQFFGGEAIPAWKAVGWLFYNAHFVAFTHPALGGGRATRNWIASGDAPTLLYAVPVVFLLVAGAAVAHYADCSDPVDGATHGASVTLGYVVLALVGVFLFGATRGDYTIAPNIVTGVLLAGVVYPAVVGGVGGAVAGALGEASE